MRNSTAPRPSQPTARRNEHVAALAAADRAERPHDRAARSGAGRLAPAGRHAGDDVRPDAAAREPLRDRLRHSHDHVSTPRGAR